jgi:hypothetical protein
VVEIAAVERDARRDTAGTGFVDYHVGDEIAGGGGRHAE